LPRKLFLALSLLLLLAPGARASETFRANIQPRPGVESSGSGTAELVLDNTETYIEFTVHLTGLTSPEIGAHIHRPDRSIAFALPSGADKSGIWQNFSQLDLIDLRAGNLFILIHTEDNPTGELRGDLSSTTVPVDPPSWSEVKALYH
jgi:hypothetical protein